jgi:hypothetical protein
MPFLLPCECGTEVSIEKSQAGAHVSCPSCQKRLDVPTIAGIGKLRNIPDASSRPNPENQLKPRWNPVWGFFAAICFLVALFGLGRAGIYFGMRFIGPELVSESEWLSFAESLGNEMSPAETWDLANYLQERGFTEKKPPERFVVKRMTEYMDRQMKLWGVAGVVGLLGLLMGSYLFRGKSST